MINYLKGEIKTIEGKSICLLNNNIGYQIYLNEKTINKLILNEEKEFYIHFSVRENDISLIGFINREELNIFKMLISVKGIGPKTALEILNTEINELKQAIESKNVTFLSQIPRIGKKTAQRLLVELENKLIKKNNENIIAHNKELEDAMIALTNLGYKRPQIIGNLKNLNLSDLKAEDIIRDFLKYINKVHE